MEASYKANQQHIERLIKVTRSWIPDSTGFSVEYSKHGKLTDLDVSSKQQVNFKGDEIESKKEQERELQKIGLSIERLDSVRLALQKMGYRGLSVSRGGTVSDYTEIGIIALLSTIDMQCLVVWNQLIMIVLSLVNMPIYKNIHCQSSGE